MAAPSKQFSMLEQMRELKIAPAEDLLSLLQDAARVHIRRGKDLPASRGSLFLACYYKSKEIRDVMARHAFGVMAYMSSLGVGPVSSENAFDESSFVDLEVNEHVIEALNRYALVAGQRSLDAIGLAAAMLATVSGAFQKHLSAGDLTVAQALECSRELFALAIKSATSPPAGLEPYKSIFQFQLDESTQGLLAASAANAQELPDAPPVVTTSWVVITALMRQHQAGSALEMLRAAARRRISDDEFDLRTREWVRDYRRGRESAQQETSVTPGVLILLRQAQELAEETTGEPIIRERHLVASLLSLPDDTGVHRFLAFLESNIERLRSELLQWVERSRLPDHLEPWRKFLSGHAAEAADDGTISVLADYIDDQRRIDDKLGFRRDVNAFATLISAKNVRPPLSIGVFGDWGSGKSFFMDMVYDAIERNAGLAVAGKAPDFHSRIVQVRFNAWHYTEANLWASLVEHIFRHIFDYLHPGDSEDAVVRKQRDELMKKIDATTAARLQLQARMDAAKLARDKAAGELEAERARSESTAAVVRRLAMTAAWEHAELTKKDKDKLQEELKRVGVDRVIQTVAEAREAVKDVASIGARLRLFWSWLFTGKLAWLRIVLLLLVLAAPFVIREAANFMGRSLDANFLSSASARIGLVIAWLMSMTPFARRVLKQLEKARKTVEQAFANAEKLRISDLKDVREKQLAADTALQQAADDLREAEGRISITQKELADLGDAHRLARFIEERVASDDYRKLLGVVATVRKDFENLTKLMSMAGADAALRVDRIVLYIDDLDRCPPERVEQVLQAVHLLLALKLFVVVVGVDARWVSRSLHMRYPKLLGARDEDEEFGASLPGFGARPEDYLEKIFQIPFWIQPMTTEAAARLIDSLIDTKNDTRDDMQTQATKVDTAAAEQAETPVAAETPNPKTEVSATEVPPTPTGDALPPQPPATPPTPGLDPLTIYPHERAFLHRVARLASRSPRSTKRFVNIYRLIRSSLPADEAAPFVDERSGEYRPVQLLLAIVIGVPNVAVELLQHVMAIDDAKRLSDVAKAIDADNARNAGAAAEWKRVHEFLADLAATPGTDFTIGELRRQIRRVGRYSFQFGRF